MTSFIIASTDKHKREAYALTLCEKNNISTFDITKLQFEKELDSPKTSIGIEDVRVIQKGLLLKPIHSQQKALIIIDAHLLTIPAQNALLKILEEPPNNTLIMLTITTKDALVPTILSRCAVIQLEEKKEKFLPEELLPIKEVLRGLPTFSLNDRLKLAQDVAKNKDEAALWLEKSIHVLRNQMLIDITAHNKIGHKYVSILRKLQKAYIITTTTNATPRLILENTFINL